MLDFMRNWCSTIHLYQFEKYSDNQINPARYDVIIALNYCFKMLFIQSGKKLFLRGQFAFDW